MEYCIKLPAEIPAPFLAEVFGAYWDTSGSPREGEIRVASLGEAEAIADTLVALRDGLGLTEPIVYHACRHDEGFGDCSAALVTL